MRADFRLYGLSDKLHNLIKLDLDYIIILPFNQALCQLTAHDFINEILVKKLNVKNLIIGYDFTFGNNREGNFKLLEQEAKKLNFTLSEIAAVKNHDYTCSSSVIRSLIKEGNIKLANQILGHNFTISGYVTRGKKLATQIGFPTANLKPNPEIIRPKFGVYKTVVFIPSLQEKFNSISNFGVRPTVSDKKEIVLESHIPGFSGDLYDKRIYVEFLDFVREEMRFCGVEELKRQIGIDVERCGGVSKVGLLGW